VGGSCGTKPDARGDVADFTRLAGTPGRVRFAFATLAAILGVSNLGEVNRISRGERDCITN
jgi:hypothetical protein